VGTSGGTVKTTTGGAEAEGGAAGAGGAPDDLAPRLIDLVVEGGRLPEQPDFAPDRVRYAVYAQESPDPLVVTATAAAGATISVAGLSAKSGEPVELTDVEPGTEFEVRVSEGGASRTYTVLYLPILFPELRVTVHEPSAWDAPLYLTPTDEHESRYIIKVDNYGVPLFYQYTARRAYDFKKHWNGVMSYYSSNEHILLNSDYEEIARVSSIGYSSTDRHEFRILPNGNYMVVVYEPVVRDLTSVGGAAEVEQIDGILQEVTPDGELVFEWNTWGHTAYEETNNPGYAHLNSVDFDHDDRWIISLHKTSEILAMDRATGDVVWRMGGESSDFDFESDPLAGPCNQHAVTVTHDAHILVFDNHTTCHDGHTRVVEYALDEREMTAELVWSYHRDGIQSRTQGSAQRLPNGNTLMGWGENDTAVMATEVDADGEVVFELEAYDPGGAALTSYRVGRFVED